MTPAAPPRSPHLQRALGPLAALLIVVGAAWFARPDGRLHITLLQTPGDAILIQSPAGRFILIDGGSDPTSLSTQLGAHMPFWQRDLAAVVLTAPDGQRLPGQVAALARYRPGYALAPNTLPRFGAANEWRRLVAMHNAPVYPLRNGAVIDLGGATLHILMAHADGAVLLIRYGATQALLHTGSATGDGVTQALAGTRLDLLAFPWQRELAESPAASLRPQRIIFTTAHSVDQPALRSYAERQRYSPALYHPKIDGSIEWISDGRQSWVITHPE